MPDPYPADRSEHRRYDPAFEGTIFTWDIDKTYLDTAFHSARELIWTAIEFAVDKRAIPGTVPLLRGIRRGRLADRGVVPVYFVSASPPQLRGVIQKKMLLDGVEYDGVTLKDQLRLVLRGQVRLIRDHVGYKLSALLHNRIAHPRLAREVLFGDDSEADARIYATYARVLRGELRGNALSEALESYGVVGQGAAHLVQAAANLPTLPAVRRAFIHLATGRSVGWVEAHGPEVKASRSPLQAAFWLWEEGDIDDRAVLDIAAEVERRRRGDDPSPLELLDDAEARGLVRPETAQTWAKSMSL